MRTNREKADRREDARRRLREQPAGRLAQTTRPRGNSQVDQRDLQRSLERMEAVVGR